MENIFDISGEDGLAVITATREVGRAACDAFSPEGLSLWQSNGEAAFQEMPHFHMHVMPRWKEDGLLCIYPEKLERRPEVELDDQADAIRAALLRR